MLRAVSKVATLALVMGIPVELLISNRPATNEEKENVRSSMEYTSRLASNNKRRQELKIEERRMQQELLMIEDRFQQDPRVIRQQQESIERDYQTLKVEEEIIKAEYAMQRRVFSLVRAVNDDVLREICLACVNDEVYSRLSHRSAPLSLAGVCRRFRNIVLTTPALWSALEFFEVGKPVKQASEWLSRAGQLPLSISVFVKQPLPITFGPVQPKNRLPQLHKLLRIVLSFSKRLQNLRINSYETDGLLTNIASLTPTDLPILQSLSIVFASEQEMALFSQSRLLKTLPALTNLSLYNIGNGVVHIPVQWNRLTSLNLTGYYRGWSHSFQVSAIAAVIKQTTNLIHLVIHPVDTSAENLTGEPILLPHLKTLTISTTIAGKTALQELIEYIDAPLLEGLSLNQTLPIPSLFTFFQRCRFIRHLSMRYDHVALAEVTSALIFCPLLTKLDLTKDLYEFGDRIIGIEDKQACNVFLEAFVHGDVAQRTCPHLECALFEGVLFNVSLDVLRRFLKRKEGTTPGLSCWKAVSLCLNVEDHDTAKKEELDELNKEQSISEVRLSLRHQIPKASRQG